MSDGDQPVIDYTIYTDLPAGTRVVLSCQRTFIDMRDEECLWVGYNEAVTIKPAVHGDYSGATGRIDVVASDEKAAELSKQIGRGPSSGIKSPVSDDFTVVCTVGARQRLREFGRNNSELSGQMVGDSGGINIVEVSKTVHVPMQEKFQPLHS